MTGHYIIVPPHRAGAAMFPIYTPGYIALNNDIRPYLNTRYWTLRSVLTLAGNYHPLPARSRGYMVTIDNTILLLLLIVSSLCLVALIHTVLFNF